MEDSGGGNLYNATVGENGTGTLRLFQNKHTTWTGRIVSRLEGCLEIGYVARMRGRCELLLAFRPTGADRPVPREFRLVKLYI